MMKKSPWRFSANSSSIQFKIKYYKISSISGNLNEFFGNVLANEDFTDVDVEVFLDATSVDASDERRNKKLKATNCLHAKQYPTLKFHTTNGCKLSEGKIRELTGALTIKNITRDMTMVVNYSNVKGGSKHPTIIFSLFGCISRKDFNLSMETGNLDDDIQVNLLLELIKTAG